MALPYKIEDLDGMTPSRGHPGGKDLAKDLIGALNSASGQATIALGEDDVAIQLDASLDGKPALATLNTADATLLYVSSAVWDGNGLLTITGNANATADTLVSYYVDAR